MIVIPFSDTKTSRTISECSSAFMLYKTNMSTQLQWNENSILKQNSDWFVSLNHAALTARCHVNEITWHMKMTPIEHIITPLHRRHNSDDNCSNNNWTFVTEQLYRRPIRPAYNKKTTTAAVRQYWKFCPTFLYKNKLLTIHSGRYRSQTRSVEITATSESATCHTK